MINKQLVTKYLEDNNMYPNLPEKYGIKIELMETGELLIDGDSKSLIDLADLLVSLSQSNPGEGNHFHIGKETVLDDESKISDVIIQRR